MRYLQRPDYPKLGEKCRAFLDSALAGSACQKELRLDWRRPVLPLRQERKAPHRKPNWPRAMQMIPLPVPYSTQPPELL